MMIPPFQTLFSVPLTCESCIKEVSNSLYKLDGISKVEADLAKQVISVKGTVPPSSIVEGIRSTGRDAILRGTGAPDCAAVTILETHSPSVRNGVRGLIRMVQVASNLTIFDLSIRGVTPGHYYATLRERGDISQGPESMGPILGAVQAKHEGRNAKGVLGTVNVGRTGVGNAFFETPIQIWEMVGRGIVVSRQMDDSLSKHDVDTVVGVVARSAGAWENEKTVCSCTGKTLWDERREQVERSGML